MTGEEIKKSINAVLKERSTNPLYGTLIITWLIWNWEIIYFTFFVSREEIDTNKLFYLKEVIIHDSTFWELWLGPLLSTIFFITLFPFILNKVYWLTKWFEVKKDKIQDFFNKEKTIKYSIYEKLLKTVEQIKDEANDRENNIINTLELKVEEYNKLSQQLNKNQITFARDIFKQFLDMKDVLNILFSYNNGKLMFSDTMTINQEKDAHFISQIKDLTTKEIITFTNTRHDDELIIELKDIGRLFREFQG